MILLAMDTSGPSLSIAVFEDGILRYEAVQQNGLTHSQTLMPMVEQALQAVQAQAADLDMIAVADGPGSFTGVRIGVAAAKGLARAAGIPCLGVDALEALAYGTGDSHAVVCPIRDARAKQVYGAAFRGGQRLMDDCVLLLQEYLAAASTLGDVLLFTGDGVAPHQEAIKEQLGARARFAPPHLLLLKAGAVGALALTRLDKAVPGADLVPRYLRAPQAERERMAREKENG